MPPAAAGAAGPAAWHAWWAISRAVTSRSKPGEGLRRTRDQVVRVIDADAPVLRWCLVEAAVALLTSPRLTRVKACPSCRWFFLDVSKNRSRRWCSMATCGSSAKARRYYWRTKHGRRPLPRRSR
ncbi:MAG: CGNR zinc finger domain-containing protein [Gemmatimonadetes bacterium]|nr:CGNR zinc finger domain-containing protein [Gemmatimonadota bacterium]